MNTITPNINRGQSFICTCFIACISLLLFWSNAKADTYTWAGLGANESWTTPENWAGVVVPPVDGVGSNTLIFASGGTNVDIQADAGSIRAGLYVLNADTNFDISTTLAAQKVVTVFSNTTSPGVIYAGIPGSTPHTYRLWRINPYFAGTTNAYIICTNNGVAGGTTLEIHGQLLGNNANVNNTTFLGDGTVILSATNGNAASSGRYYYDGTGTMILRVDEINPDGVASSGQLIQKSLSVRYGGLLKLEGTSSANYFYSAASLQVTNGSTYDLNGHALSIMGTTTIAGEGRDGVGALINNGASPATMLGNVYALTNAVIGGTGDINLEGQILSNPGSVANYKKIGTNTLRIGGVPNNSNLGMTVTQGTLALNKDPGVIGGLAIGAPGLLIEDGALARLDDYDEQINDLAIITVTNGGAFDLNGRTETIRYLRLSGAGIGAAGALYNSSANPAAMVIANQVEITSDASLGGLGDIALNGNIHSDNLSTLRKVGSSVLTCTGTNDVATFISAGTLALSGDASATGSIGVGNGAALDVSGLNTLPFALGANQTLSNSASSTGTLKGSVDASVGSIAVSYVSGTPALTVASGTLTLESATVVTVDNTGAQLAMGTYTLIAKSGGGEVSGSAPSSVTVGGAGAVGAATLQITSGELELVIAAGTNPNPTNIVAIVSGSNLVLDWPSGQGWQLQAKTNDLVNGTWMDVVGATPPFTNTIDPANSALYYRLKY